MPAIYNKYCERGGKPVFHPTNADGTSEPSPYITLLNTLYTTASSESHIRDVEINTLLSQLVGLLFDETVYEEGTQPTVANTGADRIDVGEIKSYIDTHYNTPLTLDSISTHFHFNKNYVSRCFKEAYGMSVGSYIGLVRVGRGKMLLRFSDMSIEQCGYECGYSDPNFFSRQFKKVEGMSPSEYRKSWRSGKSVNEEDSVEDTEEK